MAGAAAVRIGPLSARALDRLLARPRLALALLALVVAGVRIGYLTAPEPLWDERVWLEAGELHARGASPYGHRLYNYPPPLVQLAAAAGSGGWTRLLVAAQRAVNLAGVVAVAALAASFAPWPARARFLVAAAAAASPVVGHALFFGNLSPLVAAAALGALALERRRPAASAALLGASIAVKPLALGAGLFLAGHRLVAGPRRPRPGAALGWPLAAALLLLPGIELLPGMLARVAPAYYDPHHLSLKRALAGLGLDLPPPLIAAAVVVAAVLVFRRRPLGERETMLVAPVVALLALPIVWAHTLVVTLPLQVAALARLVERTRARAVGADASARRRAVFEIVGVVLALAAIHGSAAAGVINDWPAGLQVVVSLLPTLAPAALLAYVLGVRPRDPGEGSPLPASEAATGGTS